MAYRGLKITLPVALQGFHGSRNPSTLGPGNLSYAEGVDLDGNVVVKDGGAEKLNSSALGGGAEILSGFNWTPVSGVSADYVVLDTGDILKDTGAGTFATNMGTINAPSVHRPHFVTGGGESAGAARKLFIFSDSDQVQVASGNGAVVADISTPAADWTSGSFPIFGVQHAFRLWGAGNASDPHRVYYSNPDDHEDFLGTGSGQLSVYPGEGDQIVAGLSFRGFLILFKYPSGIYIIDTTDPTPANWSVQRLNSAVGTSGPYGIVQISNDVIIFDPGGTFHLLSAVQDFGDINTSDISRLVQLSTFIRSDVNLSAVQKVMGAWYAAKSKAWFMLPSSGSTDNDLRIMIDFNDPQIGPRYFLSRRDVGTAIWMRPSDAGIKKPTLGDEEGFVWLMDQDARQKDGATYTMELHTAEEDMSFADPGLAGTTKNGQFLEIVADLVANTIVNVTPIWDGLESDPIAVSLGSTGVALGSFVLGTHALAATGIVTAREKLTGQGRRLKLEIENSTMGDEVRISEVRVEVGVADERIRYGE